MDGSIDVDIKKQVLSSLTILDDKSQSFKVKLDQLNKLVDLKKSIPDLSKIVSYTQFLKSVRIFLATPPKTMRTSALRTIRYYTNNSNFIQEIINNKIHYFITRSLERDKHSEAERIQALKLIRTIMEIDCSLMPPCIVKSLVAIAESQEDNFCRVCLETLCEISIRNPQTSSHSNGIRTLFDSVLDPFYQGIQESLLISILYILNEEKTRVFVRPTSDLEIILSPLTNSFTLGVKIKGMSKEKEKEKEKEDEINMKKWIGSNKAVVTLLKSWIGIISLASDDHGLKSIVDALKMPQLELHDKLLDSLFEIFRLVLPKNNGDPFRPQKVSQNINLGPDALSDLPSRTRSLRHNLLNNYIAVLLIAFIDCGLIEGLVHLGNLNNNSGNNSSNSSSTNNNNSSSLLSIYNSVKPADGADIEKEQQRAVGTKATVLLGELLHLSNSLLPSAQCARLQTLPALVNAAISFRLDPRLRSRSSTMVTNLHSFSHIKSSTSSFDNTLAITLTGANKWRRIKGQDRRLDKIDDVKMKMDYSMDDQQFQQRVKDTQVLVTKDVAKWNWEIIFELLEGPLTNVTHLASALKTKFIKRMLSFLRPSNKMFSTMAWTQENLKYVRVACVILEVLISYDIGFEYLKDNKTIVQISEMLKSELDFHNQSAAGTTKASSNASHHRLLSPEKVLKTMAREYFTMLGTLSSNLLGLEIMSRNHIFDYIKPLAELPGRDDLSHLIMTSLDYNVPGASRHILQKILTSNSRVVRYLATKYMRFLLRSGAQDFSQWGIELLVQQLNDPDTKVSQLALNVLDEACDDPNGLDELIKLKPPLLKLGKHGKSLLLRFLSRTSGLSYLMEINFVEQEERLWLTGENANYVIQVEGAISEALTPLIWRQREAPDQGNNGVYLPPHFYGELTKTEEGCKLLESSNNFQTFVKIATDQRANPLDRRAAIFAIGQIGSSVPGFSFLERHHVVPMIVEMAEKSTCLSLRGTCFYALGMISCIERASEILDLCGWESPSDLSNRISVPKDLNKSTFLKVAPYDYKGSWAFNSVDLPPLQTTDPAKLEIITLINNLASHITADGASKNLKRLKLKHPELFATGDMLNMVFSLLDHYKYRLITRRFVYDCFDTAIFSNDPFDFL